MENYLQKMFIDQVKGSLNQGGGDGVSSWNDLTDRPFYDETIPSLTFDGNIEGKETIMFFPFGHWYVKLSDTYAAPEQIFGTTAYGGTAEKPELFSGIIATEDDLFRFDEDWGVDENTYACCIDVGSWGGGMFYAGIMVAKEQEIYFSDDILMKHLGISKEQIEEMREAIEPYRTVRLTPGMYFMFNRSDGLTGDPVQWVTSVTFPENFKAIDSKFLPDSVAKTHLITITVDNVSMNAYGLIYHTSTEHINELVEAFKAGEVIVFDASAVAGTTYCTRPLSMGIQTDDSEPTYGLYRFTGINPLFLGIESVYLTDQAKED